MAQDIPHPTPRHDGEDALQISSGTLTARVKPQGAELCSLRDQHGREFLWQAGAAWPRHAPILFPIVGRLQEDTLIADGQRYRLGQHGFARDLRFDVVEHGAAACRFALADSAEIRRAYPFPFRLEVAFAVEGNTLSVTFVVTNPGGVPLPFAIGAHPAFRWPLPGARDKASHRLEFERDEPGPLHRPRADGLLDPTPSQLGLTDRALPLEDALFADGALVLLAPASRRVRFAAPGGPAIDLGWEGFGQFGIWTKPGAEFLCIEPWAGYADLAGQAGEFRRKPGIQLLPPGGSRRFLHRITVEA